MFIHAIDKEITLKLIEPKDAGAIYELTDKSRDYLREWLPWLDGTTKLEDTEDYIKMSLSAFANNKGLTTVIQYNEHVVGIAGFNQINWANKTAYIGYWLGQDYQGKGIMIKVAKALTDYAINHLQLNKVEIRAAAENKKSRGIPEKLGFVNEGCIRQAEWLYDHYVDSVVYGMLADEWRNR
ncbi:N-acetyltransferase [Jeotgalibacillus sp. S-D1]|uniref:GNAT family N-acetyltransferase n=1 Tax=Jeotgalibacillus sp. S-D1 TaxID=2552189 RepID=UPI0010597FDA|nr:GNAT family protein [Jeotgalibacillus sp. S-D1]TDL30905.1 N-acetyltransferase [Jeotgalibacillus sp. S-D1]